MITIQRLNRNDKNWFSGSPNAFVHVEDMHGFTLIQRQQVSDKGADKLSTTLILPSGKFVDLNTPGFHILDRHGLVNADNGEYQRVNKEGEHLPLSLEKSDPVAINYVVDAASRNLYMLTKSGYRTWDIGMGHWWPAAGPQDLTYRQFGPIWKRNYLVAFNSTNSFLLVDSNADVMREHNNFRFCAAARDFVIVQDESDAGANTLLVKQPPYDLLREALDLDSSITLPFTVKSAYTVGDKIIMCAAVNSKNAQNANLPELGVWVLRDTTMHELATPYTHNYDLWERLQKFLAS